MNAPYTRTFTMLLRHPTTLPVTVTSIIQLIELPRSKCVYSILHLECEKSLSNDYARRYPFDRFTLKHVVNQWGGGRDRASIKDLKVSQFINYTVYTVKDVRRHIKHEVIFEVQAQ